MIQSHRTGCGRGLAPVLDRTKTAGVGRRGVAAEETTRRGRTTRGQFGAYLPDVRHAKATVEGLVITDLSYLDGNDRTASAGRFGTLDSGGTLKSR
jgi:hypothetical protein